MAWLIHSAGGPRLARLPRADADGWRVDAGPWPAWAPRYGSVELAHRGPENALLAMFPLGSRPGRWRPTSALLQRFAAPTPALRLGLLFLQAEP